jgi:hypothetical protein
MKSARDNGKVLVAGPAEEQETYPVLLTKGEIEMCLAVLKTAPMQGTKEALQIALLRIQMLEDKLASALPRREVDP